MAAPMTPPDRHGRPTPRGTLLFVHGADETSTGLARTVGRIRTQVDRRGWDVTVVAPEWRRRSDLRLGDWRRSIFRGGRPPSLPIPNLGAGIRKDAVLKMVTSYFEYRREALMEVVGPQLLADVIGYQRHRASIHEVLRAEIERTAERAEAAGRTPVLPIALSLGGIALIDLLADWPDAPVQAVVTIGSQAPLLYTFDALPGLPYDETDPPRLAMPWLNVYDSRDLLSFVAEPLFRRRDGLASVVDLRVRSGKDFPASHSAYWELPAVWDAIAVALTWRRAEPITVREARRLGFEARKAPTPRADAGTGEPTRPVDSGHSRSSM
jgi:hypothetical protein